MSYVLWIAAGLAVLFYGLAPLVVRFSLRQSVPGYMEVLSLADGPEPLRGFFEEGRRGLEGEGFVFQVVLRVRDLAPHQSMVAAFFAKRPEQDSAGIFAVFEEREGARSLGALYVEICSGFVDGREVCTNNSSLLSPFSPGPDKMVFQLPGVRDAADLYRVHTRLMASASGMRPEKKAAPDKNQVADELREDIRKELERQAARGMFYFDGKAGAYRPTLKGAYLAAWRLLWPIKWIRGLRRDRRARLLLEEIGGVNPAAG
ncbi:MAG: hypothetical protein AB1896_04100 [Thermodesulfobacteriota bacterium]